MLFYAKISGGEYTAGTPLQDAVFKGRDCFSSKFEGKIIVCISLTITCAVSDFIFSLTGACASAVF